MRTFKFSFNVKQGEETVTFLLSQNEEGLFQITRQRAGVDESPLVWGCVNGFLRTATAASQTAEQLVRFVSMEFGCLHMYDLCEVTWSAEDPDHVTSKYKYESELRRAPLV